MLLSRFGIHYLRFRVPAVVVLKSSHFWGIMSCYLVKVDVLEEHVTAFFRVEE
jgi:hypothetical protein